MTFVCTLGTPAFAEIPLVDYQFINGVLGKSVPTTGEALGNNLPNCLATALRATGLKLGFFGLSTDQFHQFSQRYETSCFDKVTTPKEGDLSVVSVICGSNVTLSHAFTHIHNGTIFEKLSPSPSDLFQIKDAGLTQQYWDHVPNNGGWSSNCHYDTIHLRPNRSQTCVFNQVNQDILNSKYASIIKDAIADIEDSISKQDFSPKRINCDELSKTINQSRTEDIDVLNRGIKDAWGYTFISADLVASYEGVPISIPNNFPSSNMRSALMYEEIYQILSSVREFGICPYQNPRKPH